MIRSIEGTTRSRERSRNPLVRLEVFAGNILTAGRRRSFICDIIDRTFPRLHLCYHCALFRAHIKYPHHDLLWFLSHRYCTTYFHIHKDISYEWIDIDKILIRKKNTNICKVISYARYIEHESTVYRDGVSSRDYIPGSRQVC